jgi:hypothetical protein
MRKIEVFSTLSEQNQLTVYNSDAVTWEAFRSVLIEDGIYNPRTMKAIEAGTKMTIENDGSLLPVGDFKLFLLPVKTDSACDEDALQSQLTELEIMFSDFRDDLDKFFEATRGIVNSQLESYKNEAAQLIAGMEKRNS